MESEEQTPNLPEPSFEEEDGDTGGQPQRAAELRALARGYTETALATLYKIAIEGTSESARIAAANALLDRGWGKCPTAPQEIEAPEYVEYKITPYQVDRPVN